MWAGVSIRMLDSHVCQYRTLLEEKWISVITVFLEFVHYLVFWTDMCQHAYFIISEKFKTQTQLGPQARTNLICWFTFFTWGWKQICFETLCSVRSIRWWTSSETLWLLSVIFHSLGKRVHSAFGTGLEKYLSGLVICFVVTGFMYICSSEVFSVHLCINIFV